MKLHGPYRRPAGHAEPAHHRAVRRADQHPQPGSARRRQRDGGAIIDMTVEVKDKKQLERVVSAIRRISGVRDIERVNRTPRTRTHRHFQIERHQDRLEGRPSQRVRAGLPARRMSLRHLHRRARHRAAEDQLRGAQASESVSDVQADAQDAERRGGGRLRDPHRLERRARIGDLFVRSSALDLRVRRSARVSLVGQAFSLRRAFAPPLRHELNPRLLRCFSWHARHRLRLSSLPPPRRTFRRNPQLSGSDACLSSTASGMSTVVLIQTLQTTSPATTVATGPPLNVFPSNGELRLFENDLFTS